MKKIFISAIVSFFFCSVNAGATSILDNDQYEQQHWHHNPQRNITYSKGIVHNKNNYPSRSYQEGYEDGYSNGYDKGYAAGLKRAKKERRKARKKRQKRQESVQQDMRAWDVKQRIAIDNINCHPYTFTVRGGRGTAKISTVPSGRIDDSTKNAKTITLNKGVKRGYVCFPHPTRLALSRFEDDDTDITLKIRDIGTFQLKHNEPGWRGNDGWRATRSAYWVLSKDDETFSSDSPWNN